MRRLEVPFRPRPSWLLRSWWWFVHGLAVLSILVSSLHPVWKCALVAGILAHGRWRSRPPVPAFAMLRPGCWSVPGLDRHELQLATESASGGWWIRLVLVDPEGSLDWVLYRDQLPSEGWKALAAEVRNTVRGS